MRSEIAEFASHLLQVERASVHTRRAYVSDLSQLAAFLEERGSSLDAATRDDLHAFLAARFTGEERHARRLKKVHSIEAKFLRGD